MFRDSQSQMKHRKLAELSVQDKQQLLTILQQQQKVYEAELQAFQQETEKQRQNIVQTERERDQYLR